jgi:hypothetical protein
MTEKHLKKRKITSPPPRDPFPPRTPPGCALGKPSGKGLPCILTWGEIHLEIEMDTKSNRIESKSNRIEIEIEIEIESNK